MNDALKSGVLAYIQALPVMIQQGVDPATPLQQIATAISERQHGKELADAISKAFAPQPPPGAEEVGEAGAPAGPPGGSEVPPGMEPSGLMQGVAPGQAGMPPGGRPDLMSLLAGLRAGGGADLRANIQRRIPA
jgi:hypothetical protein